MGMCIDWRICIDHTAEPGILDAVVDAYLDSIYEERYESLANFSLFTETFSAYHDIPDFFQELSKRDDVVSIDLYFKSDTEEAPTRKTFINGNVTNYRTIITYEPI